MKIKSVLSFQHDSLLTTFRALNPSDITEAYLVGLRLEGDFLLNRNSEITHAEQAEYVKTITSSTTSAIFGFFANAELIGTVGAQQLDSVDGAALGVFIFDRRFPNRGLGKAAVWAACYLLHHTMGISNFRAGVAHDNPISRRVFIGCGFSLMEHKKEKLLLGMNIEQLRAQPLINSESIALGPPA